MMVKYRIFPAIRRIQLFTTIQTNFKETETNYAYPHKESAISSYIEIDRPIVT